MKNDPSDKAAPVVLKGERVILKGRVDIESAPALQEALIVLLRSPVPEARVETAGLTGVDAAVLQLLYSAQESFHQLGRRLILPSPSPVLRERNQRLGDLLRL
ncbi:MAG: STAS domain-containing protein [Magnetococcales bacterium]|nr:STAS domain-containing protein [Magnetococcales bacterium]